jgi:hypothetical protein
MNSLKFSEDLIELLASTAFEVPSIFDINNLPLVSSDIAKKLAEVYMDEAINFVLSLGVKPLSASFLAEDIYTLCNDDVLLFIGRFLGGLVPAIHIYKYRAFCKSNLFLHSHPIPVSIPSPEDILSATQMGYGIECVISKVSKLRAVLTCIEPSADWDKIMAKYDSITEKVFNVSRFVVVGNGNNISFLPMPTTSEIFSLLSSYKKLMEPYAKVLYVDIDLNNKVLTYQLY